MTELKGSKSPFLSKTNWGAALTLLLPLLAAKTGITSENIFDIYNFAIGTFAAGFTIYSRIKATQKVIL